nr:uncharacterized protein LOC111994701 [Quercus suber]
MALNKGSKTLKELMATRNQVSTSKEASKSQVPANLPPPPPPQVPKDLGLKPLPEMKKKRPNEALEEVENSCAIVTQITQKVFVAEEWVKDARNEAWAEAQSQFKLKEAIKTRDSADAGLKTAERQAEDQQQKFHVTKISLATKRQLVKDLRAELQKANEATQLAKEAVEVEKSASYLLGMEETQIRLVEELVGVCWDYCDVTWGKAIDAGSKTVHYHREIRKLLGSDPSPSQHLPEASEQPLTSQTALTPVEALKGSSQAEDQGREAEGAQEKEKAQEREATSKAKANGKQVDPKAKDAASSQSSQAIDPPAPKTKT